MSQSLFSPSWYRIEGVKPRIRSHTQIHRHVYRGSVWYVMQNHSTGKFHRFTPTANALIGLMDGHRTVAEIWELACARLGDDVPSQDEMIRLLSDLHRADALQSDAPPDLHELNRRQQQHQRNRIKQYLGNPLSLRFPLFDPDRMLNRLMPWLSPMLGWFSAVLWLGMMGWALVLIAMNWTALSSDMVDRVFSVENLLLVWFVFPMIKLLHELGHAIATKANGGEVHEMGVMLLVLMPIPYVDASSATAFRGKGSRMLVGAAGMLVELFIAAVATVLWVYLEPGTERAIAYNVILVAGVSTLLFNLNPLLRYDGYYILSDYLEIPNLGQRANDYVGYLVNRYAFGMAEAASPVSAPGERAWFVSFAVLSFAYRMLMMVSIVFLIASKFFVIGVVLAIWAFTSMLLLPLWKKLTYLVSHPKLGAHRRRAVGLTAALTAIVAGSLIWVPLPSATRAEGVIWAVEQAQVRAPLDGFVAKVLAQPGAVVKRGDLLVQLEDPELSARLQLLQAQIAELTARYDAAQPSRRVQADIFNEQRVQLQAALNLARRHQAELSVYSPSDGTFTIQDAPNSPGHFVQRGELIAYVTDRSANTVRVVVPQADAEFVRHRTASVLVRSFDNVAQTLEARILREVPAATDELPSMTLSLQGGGKIGLDPRSSGEGKALEKLFIFDLEVPSGSPANYIGGRVYVRFQHEAEPLATQWYRELRRVFLRKFSL